MPPGCRKSLYVRDDDYRASFLHGNYITLGNLADEDWERIFSQRLTPLYVSVHATEPDLRRSLLRNKNAPDILKNLERLASGGIRMHTQIVVCPGINDRDHLVRTIEDLARLFPSVASIAVVPVGITRFRSKLFPLRTFRPKEAGDVLTAVNAMGGRFKRLFGNRLVFPSDEFYIKSGEPFPPASFYEGFPQIENGVGMVSAFLRDARRTRLPARRRFVAATAVTGKSFGPVLKTVLKELYRRTGISIRVLPVGNSFFGPSVTVAGLLSGKDILRAIRGKRLGSMLLIPAAALKDGDAVFLDDVRLEDIERSAAVPVRLVASFSDMVKQLLSAATTRAPSRQ